MRKNGFMTKGGVQERLLIAALSTPWVKHELRCAETLGRHCRISRALTLVFHETNVLSPFDENRILTDVFGMVPHAF
jgi:hypothetical protein